MGYHIEYTLNGSVINRALGGINYLTSGVMDMELFNIILCQGKCIVLDTYYLTHSTKGILTW